MKKLFKMEKETIKLDILASDIRETDYGNYNDCAITRALARAGRPDLIDEGLDICNKNYKVVIEGQPYRDLTKKVVSMYCGTTVPEDFSVELIFN